MKRLILEYSNSIPIYKDIYEEFVNICNEYCICNIRKGFTHRKDLFSFMRKKFDVNNVCDDSIHRYTTEYYKVMLDRRDFKPRNALNLDTKEDLPDIW